MRGAGRGGSWWRRRGGGPEWSLRAARTRHFNTRGTLYFICVYNRTEMSSTLFRVCYGDNMGWKGS